MIRILLLMGFLAGGCSTTHPTQKSPEKSGKITVSTELLSEALEGELGKIRFGIRNGTKDYILLLQFHPEETTSGIQWQISRPGAVTYDTKRDTFQREKKKPSQNQKIFNLALLSPGEEISFQTRVRLLHFPRKYHIEYFRYTLEEVQENVYMPAGGGLYQRLDREELTARLTPQQETSPGSHRIVIFPFAKQIENRPEKRSVNVSVQLRPRRFALNTALEKLGLPSCDHYSFFSRLGLWVIQKDRDSWLVSANQTIPLPKIQNTPALFHYLDSGDHPKIEVVFREETKTLFSRDIRLVPDPESRDYLAFIPLEGILPFFESLRNTGLLLDVQLDGRGGGRLVVRR